MCLPLAVKVLHRCLGDLNLKKKSNSDVTVVIAALNEAKGVGEVDPSVHFRENLLVTFNVLEAMRESGSAKVIVFFSSSTIYGEPAEFPTSEDYGPYQLLRFYSPHYLASPYLSL